MVKLFRFWLPYHIVKRFFLKNISIEANGIENYRGLQNQGFIIASNHEHSWDPIILSIALKKQVHFLSINTNFTRCLSKGWLRNLERTLFKDSISGFFLRLTQQIPVSYKDKLVNRMALLDASRYLGKGDAVGIFPKGELRLRKKRIFPGVAILAKRNNAKILPIHIQTNAPCDSFLKPNFTKAVVNIGTILKFSKSVDYTKKLVIKEIYRLK